MLKSWQTIIDRFNSLFVYQAISCHYAGSDSHFVDLAGTVSQSIKKEAEDYVKKKFGSEIEFDYIVSTYPLFTYEIYGVSK